MRKLKIRSRASACIALSLLLILLSAPGAPAQITTSNSSIDHSPPKCAINAGIAAHHFSVTTPTGSDGLSLKIVDGHPDFLIDSIQSSPDSLSYIDSDDCQDTLTKRSGSWQYVSVLGKRADLMGGKVRRVFSDGSIWEFLPIGASGLKISRTIDPTGWYTQYVYDGAKLTEVHSRKHLLSPSQPGEFVFKVIRASGVITAIQVNSSRGRLIWEYRFE